MTNIPDSVEPSAPRDDRENQGMISQPLLSVELGRANGKVIVRLDGELDVSTAPKLHEVLADAVSQEASGPVILDLSALSFVDSTGLSVLVSTNNRLKDSGRILILQSAQPIVRRLLEVTGLTEVFPMEG